MCVCVRACVRVRTCKWNSLRACLYTARTHTPAFLSSLPPSLPPSHCRALTLRTRVEPMGSDRHGSVYWLIQGAVWATNDCWYAPSHAAATGTAAGGGGGGARSSGWRCYTQGESLERLMGFLNPLGPREGPLLLRVQRLLRGAGGRADGNGDMHGHREEHEFADAGA